MLRSRSAVFSILLSAAPAFAGGGSALSPNLAFARYIASLSQSSSQMESGIAVDIEASIPRLAKQGRLQAVRHFNASGNPEYQVLRVEGDSTVKKQVIARYLSAEAQAKSTPASSVEISPANYEFRYAGSIRTAEARTYIFEITPRRRRAGLIKGQLWIDAATGLGVRQTGRLVKRPSVFVRSIEIDRETDLRDGLPYIRTTHLEVETRLIGRAELTIREHLSGPMPRFEIANLQDKGDHREIASSIAP